MGIPLLRGRGFTADDRPGAPMALLISQETARRYWPNDDPIGQKLETGWHHDDRALGGTIVRFYAMLLGTFATIALVLAAVGIYGVIAYAVQQRRRELGTRVALGASRRRVIPMVMRQALALTVIGAAAGLGAAAALTRILQGQLFSVTATDPLHS